MMSMRRHGVEGTAQEFRRGCPVFTSDGAKIGTVADVEGASVKIDARLQRDYWLNSAFVVRHEAGRVDLSFPKSELTAYKMRSPVQAREDPLRSQAPDAILSEDEQLEQRRRMEERLAEQRRGLPDTDGGASPDERNAGPD